MIGRRLLLGLALAFVLGTAALAIAGGNAGLWQAIDHRVLAALQTDEPLQPATGLLVVDVPYPEDSRSDASPRAFRASLARVLQSVARWPEVPRTVVLDVWFSANPDGIAPVMEAIAALRARGARVLAALNVADRHGGIARDPMTQHHRELYEHAVDGYGHVLLEHAFGVLKYRREVLVESHAVDGAAGHAAGNTAGQAAGHTAGQAAGHAAVPALPVLATLEAEDAARMPHDIVVPLGDDARMRARTMAANAIDDAPARRVSHLVVGSLAADSDNVLARPGTWLVGWAMSDLLAGPARVARAPLDRPAVTLAITLLAGASAAGIGAGAFAAGRRRVVPQRWPALSAAAIVIGMLAAGALLLVVQAVVAAAGHVAPVALPMAVALLAGGLAWVALRQWIAEATARLDALSAAEEHAMAYDVFVSYAHDPPAHADWVRAHVLAPIAALRHADGRPYRVFFDERSIEPGARWKRALELSLLGTRCFVPVVCTRYFERPYCREEIELADQLRIESRLAFVPIAVSLDAVPERYRRKLQFIDVRTRAAFEDELVRQVRESVDRPAAVAPERGA